MMLVNITLCTL